MYRSALLMCVLMLGCGVRPQERNPEGQEPEGQPDEEATCTEVWYPDADQDGFGDDPQSEVACEAPAGFVPDGGDCDDGAAHVFPGAEEVCDEQDNDCDGSVDEDLAVSDWYLDADLDGYGDEGQLVQRCAAPAGYVPVSGDCADDDPLVNPASADQPNLPSTDSNCDGLDGEVATSVFVDPVFGSDELSGLGMEAPVRTLDRAADIAEAEGRSWILLAGGLVSAGSGLREGLNLAGGYDVTNGWERGTVESEIEVPAGGLLVDGWSQPTVWQGLTLMAAAGQSSIVLRVRDSDSLSVEGSLLWAGPASDGLDGTDGVDGDNGFGGGSGSNGCESASGFCDSCSMPSAGSGGNNGASCGPGSGGSGGGPGYGSGWMSGDSGSQGWGGTAGGGGGSLHYNGANGYQGLPGAHGASGSEAPELGSFDWTGFTVADGTPGQPAGHGNAGGGGGGGGGGDNFCNSYGGAGGAGGGAGCGGSHGTPGLGGGASVAVLLVDASIVLSATDVRTSDGGDGGAGGLGGLGGLGGNGANGGWGQDDSGDGGDGGDGGLGGDGGDGGSGSGGPSIGVVCIGTSTVIDDGASYDLGSGGMGGEQGGGGLQMATFGCL